MSALAPTRRGMLAAIVAAPIAALPFVAQAHIGQTPFMAAHVRYIATRDLLNSGKVTGAAYDAAEADYLAAVETLDGIPCANWNEFVLALENVWGDGGIPTDELREKLLADAHRLAGRSLV